MRDIAFTEAEKDMISALRVFGALPKNMLEEYIKSINGLDNPVAAIYNLINERYLYTYPRTVSSDVSLCLNYPRSLISIAGFKSILALTGGGPNLLINVAEEPYDFTLGYNGKIYKGIYFQENGIYKLNAIRSNFGEINNDYEIPFIILLNGGASRLFVKDLRGKLCLVPPVDYYVSEVTYTKDENGERFEPVIKKYKGGTDIELER